MCRAQNKYTNPMKSILKNNNSLRISYRPSPPYHSTNIIKSTWKTMTLTPFLMPWVTPYQHSNHKTNHSRCYIYMSTHTIIFHQPKVLLSVFPNCHLSQWQWYMYKHSLWVQFQIYIMQFLVHTKSDSECLLLRAYNFSIKWS